MGNNNINSIIVLEYRRAWQVVASTRRQAAQSENWVRRSRPICTQKKEKKLAGKRGYQLYICILLLYYSGLPTNHIASIVCFSLFFLCLLTMQLTRTPFFVSFSTQSQCHFHGSNTPPTPIHSISIINIYILYLQFNSHPLIVFN